MIWIKCWREKIVDNHSGPKPCGERRLMTVHYIFIHGWGVDPSLWDRMKKHFPEHSSHYLNLGFINNLPRKENHEAPRKAKRVYITHSLGTIWALKNKIQDVNALIAFNGFYSFRPFVNVRDFQAMQERLKKDPLIRMSSFWKQCGITPKDHSLNLKRLQEGLVWLSEENAVKQATSLQKKLLSVGGGCDRILNPEIMRAMWAEFSYRELSEGGHALPWSHPEWCASQVKGFLSEIGLEKQGSG